MENNIVFTQDVPGEREWLNQHFPDHTNFETEFSGKWPVTGHFNYNNPSVWEIPPECDTDVSNVNCTRYKSLFRTPENFVSPRWCDSDLLLVNDLTFESRPKAKKAQVLHFPRSGTHFLESILFTHCGYSKDHAWKTDDPQTDHCCITGADHDRPLYDLVEKSQPDIFFCYRKNWWEQFVSYQVSRAFGYYQYHNNVKWGELQPFDITLEQIHAQAAQVRASWNALCHFRTCYPNLNFYIFEYSDLIQNQHLTHHKKIAYSKDQLISNYDSAERLFKDLYNRQFNTWAQNALSHLRTMNCKPLQTFDNIVA